MEFDPAGLAVVERYKLLIGAIVPRPIGWVSTVNAEGRANLAPFSFFNAIGSDPMALLFCPANNSDGSEKDSLRNAESSGEFVVNVATEPNERQMAASAEALAHGESEFDLTGLTPAACRVVKAPRVEEAPISFECRVERIIRMNPGAPAGGNVVIGEVVWIHAAEGLVNERFHVDPERLRAVGRMAGLTYVRTRERFDIPWGRKALEEDMM
jgi:flavin reductase (DIM6/NTAB) family NADH-FMN oxidoreductase RutF